MIVHNYMVYRIQVRWEHGWHGSSGLTRIFFWCV